MNKFLPVLFGLIMCTPAWAEIQIQNDQKYVGDDGTVHIVGEIRNGLDVPLDRVRVYASLFSDSRMVDSVSSDAPVSSIMPGMKAPFDIIVLKSGAQDFERYVLDLEYGVGHPKNQAIDITSSEISRDELDNMIITGTVANNGEITANTVSVTATIYDRHGNVAGVSRAHAEPDYLRSSGEAFFLVAIRDRAGAAVDYALIAESEEYAAVPEFPLGSGALLAASVAVYLALSKYWNRTIAGAAAAAGLGGAVSVPESGRPPAGRAARILPET